MAQTSDKFKIFHCDSQGRPDFIYSYDSRLAACITTSVNIARAYLRDATIKATLVAFAKDLDQLGPRNAWYNDPVHGCGGLEGAVFTFIGLILEVFPMIGVDDAMINPDVLARVFKREWDGVWDGGFDLLDHPIILNGSRIRDMVEAATRAICSMDRNSDDNKEVRRFSFIIANVIFHEICHLLSNFLTKGRILTPAQFNAQIDGYVEKGIGEAGRYIETILYGGTLEFYRDLNSDDRQSGLPHIIYKDSVRRIPQETIDAVNNHQFHFPYRFQGPTFSAGDFESLGSHQPRDHLIDPMNWPIMQEFKTYKHIVTFHPRPDFKRPTYPPGYEASDPVGRPPRTSSRML